MRYLTLCSDYDGTLATEGQVLPETVAALRRLLASGRRVVLVTGRELDELKTVCPCLDLFEYVVAENGALLYAPSTGVATPLAQRPPDSFVAELRARGVERVSAGRVIVATWEPHETTVLETIRDQGLELQVIFNKGAVMILPAGVNKATGLAAALRRMGLSPHNAVGVGDAENDHALLTLCECGVAVSNALPTLKEKADFVTRGARGAGVVELMEELVTDDLAAREEKLQRHHICIGADAAGREIGLSPYGHNVLLAGAADGSVPAFATKLLERLAAANYTYCVIDTKGAYAATPGAVSLGTRDRAPAVEEVLKLFRNPEESGTVDLSSLSPQQRPVFLAELWAPLAGWRSRTGLPHWLVLDEAHELLPAREAPALLDLRTVLQITSRPDLLAPAALANVDLLIADGGAAEQSLQQFWSAAGVSPSADRVKLKTGETLAWRRRDAHRGV